MMDRHWCNPARAPSGAHVDIEAQHPPPFRRNQRAAFDAVDAAIVFRFGFVWPKQNGTKKLFLQCRECQQFGCARQMDGVPTRYGHEQQTSLRNYISAQARKRYCRLARFANERRDAGRIESADRKLTPRERTALVAVDDCKLVPEAGRVLRKF
jgi:hypothetical protein